jgi:hypothetical protein
VVARDAFFGDPDVDVDEWRDVPRRHRYVHGGFGGTDTRFSFYLPPAELYRGRFFQYLEGGHGGSEHALVDSPSARAREGSPFDLAFEELGGYLLESNQGHIGNDLSGLAGDWTINWYRASAQTARFGRQLAAEMYGEEPHHGYVYGPSGGGLRTLWCMEEAGDIYDGGVPFVISTMGPLTLSAHAYGVEGLGDGLASVIDATDVGGRGDPFEGLTTQQREALGIPYRTGWPRGAEAQIRREYIFGFPLQGLLASDPTYFEDFWTVPGYAGADDAPEVAARLAEGGATVRRVLLARELDDPSMTYWARSPDAVLAVELDVDDPGRLFFAKLMITSGGAKGRNVYVGGVSGDRLIAYGVGTPELFSDVEPGDEVIYDNRDFVAFCFYHRHHPSFPENQQHCVDGGPVYPQRGEWSEPFTGRFDGRIIFCPGAHDSNVFPPTTYPRLVAENFGARADDRFRLWFMDNASHGPPSIHRPGAVWGTRLVDYSGIIDQALRDLVRWVEDGVPPPKLRYRFSADNALVLPPTAEERGGIQPVVSVLANGAARAEVPAGSVVTLEGTATVPPGAGSIVGAKWDFDGSATWPVDVTDVDGSSPSIRSEVRHSFESPGTYFPCFLVASHREGAAGRGAPVRKLARARVVVHDR